MQSAARRWLNVSVGSHGMWRPGNRAAGRSTCGDATVLPSTTRQRRQSDAGTSSALPRGKDGVQERRQGNEARDGGAEKARCRRRRGIEIAIWVWAWPAHLRHHRGHRAARWQPLRGRADRIVDGAFAVSDTSIKRPSLCLRRSCFTGLVQRDRVDAKFGNDSANAVPLRM